MNPSFDLNDAQCGLKLIEDLTSNAKQIQENVLEEILTENVQTEYLRRFLKGGFDKQLFKKNVPVLCYEDVKPYIERIANGESSFNILSAHPITQFALSSGTSGGAQKMMPLTAKYMDRSSFCSKLRTLLVYKHVEGLSQGKRMLLLFTNPDKKTPSGLVAGSVTSSYLKSSNFKNRPLNCYNTYTSPDKVILCQDIRQSMFCHLLCGLVQRDEVVCVGSIFASVIVRAMKFLEDYWEELCSNILTGYLSDWINEPGCRKAVSSILKSPNPELVTAIEQECRRKSWKGIITKLWPGTKLIEAIVTGSMSQYVPLLDFYSNGLPLVSMTYASSESYFGINLDPLCKPDNVSYTFLPNIAYFEFLPVQENNHERFDHSGKMRNEERIFDLVDLKVGHYYEPVVTNFSGLYRFRVGDILLVTGFHNNAPQFRFVKRQNVVLSIDTDKTNEEDLIKAVTRAKLMLAPLGLMLMDYTTCADISSIPGHYVIFLELKNADMNNCLPELDSHIMEECCSVMEESFGSLYAKNRKNERNYIGPLEIRVVNHGTFDSLMDFFVSRGSSISQYKTPRCIKVEPALKLLDSRVLAKFFSQKTPSSESY